MLDIPRLETNCELYAPRVGTRVAYSVHDDWGSSKRHFSILDLEHPRASFGDYLGDWNPAWSPDGSTLAWCDVRSGSSSSRRTAAEASPPVPASVRPERRVGIRERPPPPGDRGRRAPAAESPSTCLGARVGHRRSPARRPRGGMPSRPLRGRTPGGRGERAAKHARLPPRRHPASRPTTARPSRSAVTSSGLSTSAASRAGPRGRSRACTRTGRRTASGSPSPSPTRLSSTVSSAARRRCAGTWPRGSSPGSAVDGGRPPDKAQPLQAHKDVRIRPRLPDFSGAYDPLNQAVSAQELDGERRIRDSNPCYRRERAAS